MFEGSAFHKLSTIAEVDGVKKSDTLQELNGCCYFLKGKNKLQVHSRFPA
jgi:hypothetical protein